MWSVARPATPIHLTDTERLDQLGLFGGKDRLARLQDYSAWAALLEVADNKPAAIPRRVTASLPDMTRGFEISSRSYPNYHGILFMLICRILTTHSFDRMRLVKQDEHEPTSFLRHVCVCCP